MNYILFFLLMLNFNNDKQTNKQSINQEVIITIIDNNNEKLTGVKNGNKYSNFDGELAINKGDSVLLELVSYEIINIENIENDTIIKMINIK